MRDSADETEYPYGMSRRQWMKYFGVGGVAAGVSSFAGCSGDGGDGGDGGGDGGDGGSDGGDGGGTPGGDGGDGMDGDGGEQRPFPLTPDATPDEWDGVELRWTTDNAAGPLYSMFGNVMAEDTGGALTFNDGQVLPPDNYYSKINSEFVGGGEVPFDIVLHLPLHIGDFQARDIFETMDKYLDSYESGPIQEYLDGIIDPYKAFYNKWEDSWVSLPIDGDIHNLFYRPSFFNDETHQQQYQDEYGQELRPPETWPEFNQVAKYFTENTEDGTYGTMVYGARPWNFGWWVDRAASLGMVYFDEEMEPQINGEAGVKALEHMVETVQYAPPETTQFGVAETINQWQQGNVVMAPWWIDLTEFTARGDFPVVGDQSAAAMPGWEQDDGSIRFNACMLYNRTYSIAANLGDEVKKDAAFYAILRLSHPSISVDACADPFDGLDPFHDEHYTDAAAEAYTESNPLRGTGEGFPKNVPIFAPDKEYPEGRSAFEQAKQHLEAGQKNLENGFPQPNWPGASQYIEDLSIHIQRALTGEEEPQEALDAVADAWRSTRDELGADAQREVYQREFFSKAQEFDYV